MSQLAKIKAIAVFCGSNDGASPVYTEQATDLGRAFLKNNYELIYGGGSIGVMGALASTVHNGGGKVTGIIPDALYTISGDGIGEVIVVPDMHTRKTIMSKRADAFIALPGGFGTIEELMEVTAWSQLNIHSKPVLVLNTIGFYGPIISWINHAKAQGFIRTPNDTIIRFCDTVPELLKALEAYEAPQGRYGLVWDIVGGAVVPTKDPEDVI